MDFLSSMSAVSAYLWIALVMLVLALVLLVSARKAREHGAKLRKAQSAKRRSEAQKQAHARRANKLADTQQGGDTGGYQGFQQNLNGTDRSLYGRSEAEPQKIAEWPFPSNGERS